MVTENIHSKINTAVGVMVECSAQGGPVSSISAGGNSLSLFMLKVKMVWEQLIQKYQ